MKRIQIFLPVVILLLACTSVVGQEQAAAPVYQEGDFWLFREVAEGRDGPVAKWDVLYSIKYGNGKLEAFEINESKKTEILVPPDNKIDQITDILVGSEKQLLQFPMFVGRRWKNTYAYRDARGKTRDATSQTEITKIEEVTTPAGKFTAFKIERLDLAGASRWTLVCFYSPLTRSIVKYHFESSLGGTLDRELVKFDSANK